MQRKHGVMGNGHSYKVYQDISFKSYIIAALFALGLFEIGLINSVLIYVLPLTVILVYLNTFCLS